MKAMCIFYVLPLGAINDDDDVNYYRAGNNQQLEPIRFFSVHQEMYDAQI